MRLKDQEKSCLIYKSKFEITHVDGSNDWKALISYLVVKLLENRKLVRIVQEL